MALGGLAPIRRNLLKKIKIVYCNVSTCVKLNKIISKYDTIFDFGVKFDIFGFGYFSRSLGLERVSQKRILQIMFPTNCQVQNDRTNLEKKSCFCQNLQFSVCFAIETSILKLRPLLRFLCLINSFYRRYVSSMYNRSNRLNTLNTCCPLLSVNCPSMSVNVTELSVNVL